MDVHNAQLYEGQSDFEDKDMEFTPEMGSSDHQKNSNSAISDSKLKFKKKSDIHSGTLN